LWAGNFSIGGPFSLILIKLFKLSVLKREHTHTQGGKKLTSSLLRQNYWILRNDRALKNVISNCVKCNRYAASNNKQLIGPLPEPRVKFTKAFTHTGCDYAGPIRVKSSSGKGIKTTKGYIAIFICLATKAIHIELVSNSTSTAFIAALKRFMARRGVGNHFYSDNGTNFIGASKILNREIVLEDNHNNLKVFDKQILRFTNSKKIEGHFNPPIAPHFGGLWEAGVKSIKHHLKRRVGNEILTYEEMTTTLCQIEACLNSRPLCQLTDDIEDLNFLTPAHFLIEGPLLLPLEKSLFDCTINRLNRWQLCNRLYQEFWKKWNNEYFHRLQQRTKWTTKHDNLKKLELKKTIYQQENGPWAVL
jgi:hypothetical protein